MAKAFRSPLVGYNHNLEHFGHVFHVQTEDSGPAMPRLFTHLFYEGSILVSRKREYDPALGDDKVRIMMRDQHKSVILDLMQARLDDRIIAFFAARGQDLSAAAGALGGALPAAPLQATPGPVMMVPAVSDEQMEAPLDGEPGAAAGAAFDDTGQVAAAVAAASEDTIANGPEVPPPATEHFQVGGNAGLGARVETTVAPAPAARAVEVFAEPPPPLAPMGRRRKTLPIEAAQQRLALGAPGDSSSDPRRGVVVRSETQALGKLTGHEGVVVQRNVVVGDAPARPQRIRPPVPYVVTGGAHTERPPQRPPAAPAAAAKSKAGASGTPGPQPTPGPVGEGARPTGSGFGVGRTDDKSLDEVILEYLGEED